MALRTLMTGFWFVACLLVAGCSSWLQPNIKTDLAQLKPGNYQLDTNHATVLFKVDHMGFSKFVGRFNEFDASLDFDPKNFANSRLNAIVEMASIDVNSESFEETLRGNNWLNVDDYPQAVFSTVSAKKLSRNKAEFVGDLTFLGVTAPVSILVTFNGGANNLLTQKYTLGFSASGTFKRSDFGLDRYVPTIGDTIELEIHAEFQKIKKQ